MLSTAGGDVEKVTQNFEHGTRDALDLLGRAVRTIHGRSDPDLEQEAFMRTLSAFRRTPKVIHPEALMWKIVKDTVADHWRAHRKNRAEDVDQIGEHLLAHRPDIENALDRKRRVELLHDAIFRLGCAIRGPVYLFYVEDYSIATIARVYRKTPSAIKMALHRGRRQIEKMCRNVAAKKSCFPRH
jgi:RNA polymerase sigma factor (sigma-70 family)